MTKSTGYEHIGQTRGCADHDHDMVHELSRRLDAVWRYDQYIANAESKPDLQKFWRNVKGHEQETIEQLKRLLGAHSEQMLLNERPGSCDSIAGSSKVPGVLRIAGRGFGRRMTFHRMS